MWFSLLLRSCVCMWATIYENRSSYAYIMDIILIDSVIVYYMGGGRRGCMQYPRYPESTGRLQ